LGKGVPGTGVVLFGTIPGCSGGIYGLGRGLGGRVQKIAGAGPGGNHDERRDARVAAAAGESCAVAAGADFGGARSLSELLRAGAARHLAAGMRLRGGVGGYFEGGEPAVVHYGVARDSARVSASKVCDVRTDPHAERDCGVWPGSAFGAAGVEP